MSSSMQQQQLEWRRAKVLELMSKGENNQSEIARILQVGRSIVCRDVAILRQQAKENIARCVDERLPEEYEKCLVGLNNILKEAWRMSQADDNTKIDKIKALALAKECYAMKLEVLTNATVVDDAIRFVSSFNSKKPNEAKVEENSSNYAKIPDDEGSESLSTTTVNNTF
jgi:DNA-binding transcriptional regulator LsrR (DeoR family)